MGTAEVEPPAVGRPAGEHLQFVRTLLNGLYLVTVDVVDDEVALRVEHLYLVGMYRVEALQGAVRGVGYELELRMPGGVHASREQRVVPHIDLLHLPVVGDDGTAVVLAGVELHAVGVPLLVAVAVDALATRLGGAEHVVDHHLLVERLEAPLVQRQLLVRHVGRRNHAEAHPCVDAVSRDVDVERLIAQPLTVLFGIDLHADTASPGSSRQLVPLVHLGACLQATANDFLTAYREADDSIVGTCQQLEAQRCHVHGDGHLGVVGVYLRQQVGLLVMLRHLGGAAGRQQQDGKE